LNCFSCAVWNTILDFLLKANLSFIKQFKKENKLLTSLLRSAVIVADLLPARRFFLALMHVLGVAAVVRDGRDTKRNDRKAKQHDEHHADTAREKPHAGIILV